MAAASNDQRTRTLIDAAHKARAEGRGDEAAQLLREAELESPQHPLVLNEIGQRMLLSGDLARAHELLGQAVKADASNASLWINFAATLRGLNRHDEELQALDQALALEPGDLSGNQQRGDV
jgi:tetratricopeptide (TPR) repeat protein